MANKPDHLSRLDIHIDTFQHRLILVVSKCDVLECHAADNAMVNRVLRVLYIRFFVSYLKDPFSRGHGFCKPTRYEAH